MTAGLADAGTVSTPAALAACADVVAEAGAQVWRCPDSELRGAVDACAGLISAANGLLLRMVAEAQSRGVPAADGAPNTAAWLRTRLRLTPRDARQAVAVAEAVRGPLSATGRALAAGRLNLAQAAAVCAAVSDLPASVDADLRQRVEADLIERAAHFDAVALARLGLRILSLLAPEVGEALEAAALKREEARAAERRELWLTDGGDGTTYLRGRLDSEAAAIVKAALDPLAAPRPADADGPDRRSGAHRRADALVELARRALRAGQVRGRDGEPAKVVVTVDYATLLHGLGSASTSDGTAISPALARKLACGAEIIPAVLGTDGAVLDVGRAQRLFTGGRRRALVLRDGGCAFPGCDRPPDWCDGHHVVAWWRGGRTSVGGGVLLCGHHHSVIHHGHWTVRIAADGIPEFTPPTWVDPRRRPLRHARFRLRRGRSSDADGDRDRDRTGTQPSRADPAGRTAPSQS